MREIIIWICRKLGIDGYIARIIVNPANVVIAEMVILEKDTNWHRVSFHFKWTDDNEKKLYIDGILISKE